MSLGHIVALGGGGFAMEPDNPALDDYILSLARVPKPRRLLRAHRERGLRQLLPAVLRRLRRPRLRARPPAAFQAPRGRSAGVRPRAGRDLRRRRQHRQPAGGLARPRTGQATARGERPGGGAVRHQRGLALLVRSRRDGFIRPDVGRPARRARLPARQQLPPLRRRAPTPPDVPATGGRRDAPRLRRQRRLRAPLRRRPAGARYPFPAERRRVPRGVAGRNVVETPIAAEAL